MLRRCTALVQGIVAERQGVFRDAERLALQLAVLADAKGILTECRSLARSNHQAFVECVQTSIATDPELANPYLHLTSLVGKYDALVVLDQALP